MNVAAFTVACQIAQANVPSLTLLMNRPFDGSKESYDKNKWGIVRVEV